MHEHVFKKLKVVQVMVHFVSLDIPPSSLLVYSNACDAPSFTSSSFLLSVPFHPH